MDTLVCLIVVVFCPYASVGLMWKAIALGLVIGSYIIWLCYPGIPVAIPIIIQCGVAVTIHLYYRYDSTR